MELLLKDVKINTWFMCLPLELIIEIEQFRLCEVRAKSRNFIKCAWIKDEIDEHKDRGLIFKNLDSNEEKNELDEKLPLDYDIIDIENTTDYIVKYWLFNIDDVNIVDMIDNDKLRSLSSEFDDYFLLLLKLNCGLYAYIDHQWGSGSYGCCHKLHIYVSKDLDKLLMEIPLNDINCKLKDFSKLIGQN